MTRRSRLLIAVAGVALEVLVVLLTHPADAPWWRDAASAIFAALSLATFALVAVAAVRDNARNSRTVTASRPHLDPFANDWNNRR